MNKRVGFSLFLNVVLYESLFLKLVLVLNYVLKFNSEYFNTVR